MAIDFHDIRPGDQVRTDAAPDEWSTVTEVYITAVEVATAGGVRQAYNDPARLWAPPGGVKILDHRRLRLR